MATNYLNWDHPKAGDILPNGATVLKVTPSPGKDCCYVGAILDGDFVTWACSIGDNGDPITYWGHYYETIDDMLQDDRMTERPTTQPNPMETTCLETQ